jgi:hypothetical protein
LPETAQLAARQLIEEQQRASLLRSHSLEPHRTETRVIGSTSCVCHCTGFQGVALAKM